MAGKHMKGGSTSSTTREMHIKTARYHFTLPRMATVKKTVASVDKDMEKSSASLSAGGKVTQKSTKIFQVIKPQNSSAPC